jgi:ferredoxin
MRSFKDSVYWRFIQTRDVAIAYREICLRCGIWVEQCPAKALNLIRDKSKGEPMDVQKLSQLH